MQRGPYDIKSSKNIYQNPWIQVREDQVTKPDGQAATFGIVEYSSGVSVVAINDKDEVYLIKEYAYALDEYSISLPQGGVEAGESPLDAAKRELKEEAGVTSDNWTDLGYINPYTMIIKGPIYLFLARHAKPASLPESGIEIITVPFATAVQWVMESKINHSGSCMAILKAREYI